MQTSVFQSIQKKIGYATEFYGKNRVGAVEILFCNFYNNYEIHGPIETGQIRKNPLYIENQLSKPRLVCIIKVISKEEHNNSFFLS